MRMERNELVSILNDSLEGKMTLDIAILVIREYCLVKGKEAKDIDALVTAIQLHNVVKRYLQIAVDELCTILEVSKLLSKEGKIVKYQ